MYLLKKSIKIAKPTSDGYVCEIPFTVPPSSRLYYHCTPTGTCRTEVSITQAQISQVKCKLGDKQFQLQFRTILQE
jgi:hypothetical protein